MSLGRFLDDEENVREQLDDLREVARRPAHLSADERARLIEFPSLFRSLCHALSLAKHRDYSTTVVSRLNRAALQSHDQMYRRSFRLLSRFREFFTSSFPQALRSEPWLVSWAFLMLFGIGIAAAVGIQYHPELAYSILGSDQVNTMERMYGDSGPMGVGRGASSDVYMFGHYIFNNVGIGFRTCASGVLLGIGTIFFLSYNGLLLGAVVGHLYRVGYGDNLFSFVIAHGAFELTGIAISGVAGLLLGRAVVSPGRRTRGEALRAIAPKFLTIVMGAAGMLVIAAFIEAFWSPRNFESSTLKYQVGGVIWALVLCYFLFAGRRRRGS